ncbi:MAG TPA: 4Fe-4S dicluster domain-containing protein [Tepidisphaeraceae bacterium]|jgi:ferredoxin-type protein NapG
MSQDKPIQRRQFFRRGLGELLKPLASALEPIERTLAPVDPAHPRRKADANSLPLKLWLRAPGALAEKKFIETCSRCGDCVSVCPAEAIKLDRTGELGAGAPYIDPAGSPCVACDGLLCMAACPSGALLPTPLTQIKMGTAVWREHLCVRSSGDDCKLCVDACPMGSAALEIVDDAVQVKPLGCIGCGLCENVCPTDPKAITVIPKAAREI